MSPLWPLQGLLSWCLISVKSTHLKIRHSLMKFTGTKGARPSNEWQQHDCMTGYQDSSSSNGCQVTWCIDSSYNHVIFPQGAALWVGDYSGRTPLHIAASQGHHEMVHYLINCGCSVHHRDQYGRSPLDDSVRFNRHDIIRLLVQTGAHLTVASARLGMILCR